MAQREVKKAIQALEMRGTCNLSACAVPGTLPAETRNELPARAFGLPKERKYPMYTMADGKLTPSASHAASAKARAQAEYNNGRLSKKNLLQIDRKADKILRECGTKGRKSNPGPVVGSSAALVGRLKF